jgi:hypothetical protein
MNPFYILASFLLSPSHGHLCGLTPHDILMFQVSQVLDQLIYLTREKNLVTLFLTCILLWDTDETPYNNDQSYDVSARIRLHTNHYNTLEIQNTIHLGLWSLLQMNVSCIRFTTFDPQISLAERLITVPELLRRHRQPMADKMIRSELFYSPFPFQTKEQRNNYKKKYILKGSDDGVYLLTYGADPFLRSCQLCNHSGNSQQF